MILNTVDWNSLLGAFAGGAGLGAFFFFGLFWTMEHVLRCPWPVGVALVSFLLRTFIVVVGVYWLMAGVPARAFVALVGFVIARLVLVRLFGSKSCKLPE